MRQVVKFLSLFALLVALQSFDARAEEPAPTSGQSFYGTWRLLSGEQKQQFVAGYMQGWKDASRVTDILITFVKENPTDAVNGLEKLRKLYDMSDYSPAPLVAQIDRFFADPRNQTAAFSLAVSAARGNLR